MQILQTSDPIKAIAFAQECIQPPPNGHEGLDIFLNKSIFLQTGQISTCNKEEAKKLKIPIWEAQHVGGSIVCFPGDLSLCRTKWGIDDWGERLFNATINMLIDRGIEVTTNNNDVLANGKKVMSWARAMLITGWVQTVAHFSVNIDLDLICRICTKPMEKIPGALSEYGIDANVILREINIKE